MTYFPLVPQGKFGFLPTEGCACLIRRRIRVLVFAGTTWTGKARTKIRNRIFEDSEKALESEFRLFQTTTNIGGYLYQWWPMTNDPLMFMISIGTNGNQATTGDQLVVSAAEGRSPNARVDSALILHRVGEELRVP